MRTSTRRHEWIARLGSIYRSREDNSNRRHFNDLPGLRWRGWDVEFDNNFTVITIHDALGRGTTIKNGTIVELPATATSGSWGGSSFNTIVDLCREFGASAVRIPRVMENGWGTFSIHQARVTSGDVLLDNFYLHHMLSNKFDPSPAAFEMAAKYHGKRRGYMRYLQRYYGLHVEEEPPYRFWARNCGNVVGADPIEFLEAGFKQLALWNRVKRRCHSTASRARDVYYFIKRSRSVSFGHDDVANAVDHWTLIHDAPFKHARSCEWCKEHLDVDKIRLFLIRQIPNEAQARLGVDAMECYDWYHATEHFMDDDNIDARLGGGKVVTCHEDIDIVDENDPMDVYNHRPAMWEWTGSQEKWPPIEAITGFFFDVMLQGRECPCWKCRMGRLIHLREKVDESTKGPKIKCGFCGRPVHNQSHGRQLHAVATRSGASMAIACCSCYNEHGLATRPSINTNTR